MTVAGSLDADQVLVQLQDVFRHAFFDDTLEILASDTAADVEGWDSLSHVRLLLAVERHFRIRIAPGEADRLDNVGDLAGLIAAKLAPAPEAGS